MHSMKAAMQHTGLIGGRTTPSDHPATGPKKVVKDGSAHPHPGSDAQVSTFSEILSKDLKFHDFLVLF